MLSKRVDKRARTGGWTPVIAGGRIFVWTGRSEQRYVRLAHIEAHGVLSAQNRDAKHILPSPESIMTAPDLTKPLSADFTPPTNEQIGATDHPEPCKAPSSDLPGLATLI